MDKYIARGALFAGLSFALALYESLVSTPVRWGLLAGYGIVFSYGVIIILTRDKRPDAETER